METVCTKPTDPEIVTPERLYDEAVKACRDSFRAYLYATAPVPGEYRMDTPHIVGICRELQAATEAVERGECYYVFITCPPQHWKSTTCSQHYPIWHLGRNPEHRFIEVSYSSGIAVRNSRMARRLVDHPVTREAFDIALDPKFKAADNWDLKDHRGGMLAAGFGGGITGNPADIIVIDDYFRGREEAESETIRNKVWESFQSDVMSRRAPAHAVVILATRWHEDDLIGRIENEMSKDPMFPQFKKVRYPAWTEEYEWLFTERYSGQFYESTQVVLGKYAWSALYMCDPTPREGGLIQVDNIDFVDEMPDGLKWVRFWDPASGKRERAKNDPDWSEGTKGAVSKDPADPRILHVWISDVVSVQAEAPERDRLIIKTAERDGPGVKVGIESNAAYKDTYLWIRKLLRGKSKVRPLLASKDLVARGEALEPIFEAGHVHVLRAEWNDAWVSQLRSFPNGAHDDKVASMIGMFEMASKDRHIIFGPPEVILGAADTRKIEGADDESPPREAPRYQDIEIDDGEELPDGEAETMVSARRRTLDDDAAWN